MKDNIYELMNDIEFDFDEYIREDFSEIEKKKLKKNFKKSINKSRSGMNKKAVCIAMIALMLAGSMCFEDTRTYAFEKITLFYKDVANFLGIKKDLQDYSTVVNSSVADNGITLQLNEVILNNNELIVSTNIKSDTILEPADMWAVSPSIEINGVDVSGVGSTGSSENLDEYTTQSILSYDLKSIDNLDLSGNVEIKINHSSVMLGLSDYKGEWNFAFTANGDALKSDTHIQKLDKTINLNNGECYTLEQYFSNKLGQNIYGTFKNVKLDEHGVSEDEFHLRGHDDLGNKVGFFVTKQNFNNKTFIMKTDQIGGQASEEASVLTLTPILEKRINFRYIDEEHKTATYDTVEEVAGEEFEIRLK